MPDELELETEDQELETTEQEPDAPAQAPAPVAPMIDPDAMAQAFRNALSQPAVQQDPVEALYAKAAEVFYSDPVEYQRLSRQANNLEMDRRQSQFIQQANEMMRPIKEEALISRVAGNYDPEVKQKLKGFLKGMDLSSIESSPDAMSFLDYAAKGMQSERPARPKAPMSHGNNAGSATMNASDTDVTQMMNWFGFTREQAMEAIREANNG